MLPILLCAIAGALAGGCIVPAAIGLMTLGEQASDAFLGFRAGVRMAAQGAVMFGLPALAGAAVGGLAAWLWPGA